MTEIPTPSSEPLVNIKRRLRPRTYSIAIYIVGLFILAQIIAVISIFWFRQTVVKVDVIGPALKSVEDIKLAQLPLDSSIKLPELAHLSSPQFSARLTVPHQDSVEERILRLNDQAREFRRQNDFPLAEASLKRAFDLDPNYPNTLINFAMLEEARGDNSKALDYWQQVLGLGDKASATLRLARERASVLEETLRKERLARDREKMILKSSRKVVIDTVTTSPLLIPLKPETLQVDFKIRTNGESISSGKMRIQVFFYEKMANNDLLPAKIDAKFLADRPTWSGGNETLRVRYSRATQQRADDTQFYGYLIRVLYDGEIQDEKASPADLLTAFPYQPPQN